MTKAQAEKLIHEIGVAEGRSMARKTGAAKRMSPSPAVVNMARETAERSSSVFSLGEPQRILLKGFKAGYREIVMQRRAEEKGSGGMSRKSNPTRRRNLGGSLLDAAFNGGKRWITSGARDASGVSNANATQYGFSKWYNSIPPKTDQASREAGDTKAKLLKSFKEGVAAGKRLESAAYSKKSNPQVGDYELSFVRSYAVRPSVVVLRFDWKSLKSVSTQGSFEITSPKGELYWESGSRLPDAVLQAARQTLKRWQR